MQRKPADKKTEKKPAKKLAKPKFRDNAEEVIQALEALKTRPIRFSS